MGEDMGITGRHTHVVLAMLATAWAAVAMSARAIEMSIPDVPTIAGREVLVPIEVTDLTDANVTAAEFILHYDVEELEILGVSQAGTLTDGWLAASRDFGGRFKVAMASATPATGAGVLIHVRVLARPEATGEIPLSLTNTALNTDPATTVTNGALIIDGSIDRNTVPVAVAGDDITIPVGEILTLDGGASTDEDGSIVSYEWEMGDGATLTGAQAQHAYNWVGQYEVVLTVGDDLGGLATDALIVEVTPPEPTDPPPTGESATLRGGGGVVAIVPSVVFDGRPLALGVAPVDANPTLGAVGPVGFAAPSARLIREIEILREQSAVHVLEEPAEMTFFFTEEDLLLPDGGAINAEHLVPFTIAADGSIEILRVLARDLGSTTFAVRHLSVIGLGMSDFNDAPTVNRVPEPVHIETRPTEYAVPFSPTVGEAIFWDDETAIGSLVYTAESSDPGVAVASVTDGPSGAEVTLTVGAASEGDTVVTVVATDGGGLLATTAFDVTVTFPLSMTATANGRVGAAFSTDEGEALTIVVDATHDDPTEVVTIAAADGSLPENMAFTPVTSSVPARAVMQFTPSVDQGRDEPYLVLLTATDKVGREARLELALTVVNVNDAPEFGATPDATVDEGAALEFVVTATDPDGDDPLTFFALGLPPGSAFDADTATFSWTPNFTQEGAYVAIFGVRDPSGAQATTEVTIAVVEANESPVFAALGPQTVAEGVPLTFRLSATDAEDSTLTYGTETPLPPGATLDAETGDFAWEPGFDQSGVYTLAFVARDEPGAEGSLDVVVTVTDINRAPEFSDLLAAPKTAFVGSEFVLNVDVEDADGDPLTVTTTSEASGFEYDPAAGVARWTPDATHEGLHEVEFSADDGRGGSADARVLVTVSVVSPVWQPITVGEAREGDPFALRAEASHPQGKPMALSLVSAPAVPSDAVSQDGAALLIQWTPDFLAAGDYLLTFVATAEGDPAASIARSLTVENTNRPPTLVPVAEQALTENVQFQMTLAATDPDVDDTLAFAATALPAGATLDAASGLLQWTPGYDQAGSHAVEVSVSDGQGAEHTSSLILTVGDANRNPTLLPEPAAVAAVEGNLLRVTFAATDADSADELRYDIAPVPDGGSMDATTGSFLWAPRREDVGVHTFIVTVEDGRGGSASRPLTVTVTALDGEPPTATVALASDHAVVDDNYYATGSDVSLRLTASDNRTSVEDLLVLLRNEGEEWSSPRAFRSPMPWTLMSGDGERYFDVRFVDEAGNEATERGRVVVDTAPPKVTHQPVTLADQHAAISITADVTDTAPVTVRLHYRPGGRAAYIPADMSGDGAYHASISAFDASLGVAYYVEAEDALGSVTTFPAEGEDAPIGVAVRGRFTQDAALQPYAWHMFSVPFSPISTNLTAEFDRLLGKDHWQADRWAAPRAANERATPVAQLSEAFWLVASSPMLVDLDGVLSGPADPREIRLQAGWNSVANPFSFPVAFGAIEVRTPDGPARLGSVEAGVYVRPRFWVWQDATSNNVTDGAYTMVTSLASSWEPWAGYWVFAEEPATILVHPAPQSSPPLPAPTAPPPAWSATASLLTERSESRVVLALAEGARWGHDGMDAEQPPAPTLTTLALIQADARYQRLTLPASADEWSWDLQARAAEPAALRLGDPPPAGYRLYVENYGAAARSQVRPGDSLPLERGQHRLRVRVTRQKLGQDIAGVAPRVTALHASYPNPFNPDTWIPFSLSEDADVAVAIFDMRGQVVNSVAMGVLPAGRYSDRSRAIQWDGRDNNGEPAASGVYIVELRAGAERMRQKLTLAR